MKGASFKDLNEFRRAQETAQARSLIIRPDSPEAKARESVDNAVGELSHMWGTRLEYAKALIAAGAPDAEVMARAEALAIADHRTRTEACLTLFGIYGGKIPDGLKYAAHVLDVPLPTQATQPAEDETAKAG